MEIKLDLVNFEQAKALKALGFYGYSDNDRELYVTSNEVTWEQAIEIPYSDGYDYVTHYETFPVDVIGQLLYDVRKNNCTYKTKFQTVYAPTLELAAKWLRNEKNILIEPRTKAFSVEGFFKCYVINCNKDSNKKVEYEIYWTDFGGDNVCFPTWESALSAGINKAIEILKNN